MRIIKIIMGIALIGISTAAFLFFCVMPLYFNIIGVWITPKDPSITIMYAIITTVSVIGIFGGFMLMSSNVRR